MQSEFASSNFKSTKAELIAFLRLGHGGCGSVSLGRFPLSRTAVRAWRMLAPGILADSL